MKIEITKSLEEILGLNENPVPISKLAGKCALILVPYSGDKVINKLRKRMIFDLEEENKTKDKPLDSKSIRTYANLISGLIWASKYYILADVGYRVYNLLT